MSDFAQGWIVWSAPRRALVAALKAEGVPAFITRNARPTRVFAPDTPSVAERITKRIPGATILEFGAGDDFAGEVALVFEGRRRATLKAPGSLKTPADLRKATKFLDAAGDRLGRVFEPAQRGDPVPGAIVALMGVDYFDVESLRYDVLLEQRVHGPSGDDLGDGFLYVNEEGLVEPFYEAPPASVPPSGPATALLEEIRKLDPAKASASTLAMLEELAKTGPQGEPSASRAQTVREAAASLLSRCLESLPEPRKTREARRLGVALLVTSDGATRGLLALALRRVGGLAQPYLEEALAKELDATAARRIYETLHDVRHDLPDEELFERTRSHSVLDRKGAYALLEQSASPRVLPVLERCARAESDQTAHELVAGVVARLRAEQ